MISALAFGIGTHEVILILVIVVVLFGATKLPQLGSAIGQGIKNFKRGMREVKEEDEEAKKAEAQRQLEDSSKKDDTNNDSAGKA